MLKQDKNSLSKMVGGGVSDSPILLTVLQSTEVNIERGTSGVMGTTATVARLEAICFFVSLEPGVVYM